MAELDEPEQRSFGSAATSAASDVEPIVQKLSPTESPPVQVMDQSGGYGKHRIPSLVFERSKPSTTFDWSIASNESLFSIQLGDNSFSWDYSIMSSGDNMPMSGELSNSSELVPSTSQPSGDTVLPDDDSSPEKNLKANKKSVVFMLENNDSQSKEKPLNVVAVGPINSSKYSDESGASPNSFSFPM
ncbi:hypothetical protein SAY87_013346 [Trapa incisa]|uniref:Uncharacterized protein n=1 Tax=Trapa incisa TaxID=236973 RepID=A0AAN7QD58_9MYRT|nr:hypothetical protein SAY87_013346 [Trapa incisa]